MALMNCPKCGNEISDKATACPKCGKKFEQKNKELMCPECGKELEKGTNTCSFCGCPIGEQLQKVEVTKIALDKKKIIIMISVVIGIIAILLIALGINKQQNEKNKKKYLSNLSEVTTTMFSGASEAEDAGGLIHDVWYNTIYKKRDDTTDKYTLINNEESSYSYNTFYSDFNNSLSNLFNDPSFQIKIAIVKENQESTQELMRKLKEVPEGYQEAYEAVNTLYDSYLELTNLVINPTGSLSSYTEKFNEADSNVVKYYKSMQVYIEN